MKRYEKDGNFVWEFLNEEELKQWLKELKVPEEYISNFSNWLVSFTLQEGSTIKLLEKTLHPLTMAYEGCKNLKGDRPLCSNGTENGYKPVNYYHVIDNRSKLEKTRVYTFENAFIILNVSQNLNSAQGSK